MQGYENNLWLFYAGLLASLEKTTVCKKV